MCGTHGRRLQQICHFKLHSNVPFKALTFRFVFDASRLVKHNFYPNVTTLRSGLCCRNSVCPLSVCRLSVTLVHPTQGVEPFGKISSPLCTLAIV